MGPLKKVQSLTPKMYMREANSLKGVVSLIWGGATVSTKLSGCRLLTRGKAGAREWGTPLPWKLDFSMFSSVDEGKNGAKR